MNYLETYCSNRMKATGENASHISILSIRVSDILLLVFLNVLIFQDFLEKNVASIFSNVDELTALIALTLAFVVLLANGRRRMFGTEGQLLALCFILLIVLGLTSSLSQRIQTSYLAIATDILLCNKFFAVLFSTVVIFTDYSTRPVLSLLEKEARFLLPILFVLAVGNIFFNFGMRFDEYRYGLTPFKFLFSHPSVVVWTCVLFCSVLLRNRTKNMAFVLLGCCTILLTLRSKGICWVAALAVMLLFMKKGKLSLPVLVLGAALVSYFAWDQLVYYYSSTGITTSRGALQFASFEIANDFFPLGAGYATFGSAVTASDPNYYSSLYYAFGINDIWGMSIDNPMFIADSFWPIIFGQFGYIGVLFVMAIFALLVKVSLNCTSNWMPLLAMVIYLILSSFGETSIFNPSAVLFGFVMGLLLVEHKRCKDSRQ